ncbi:MAG: PIN domain-containing protein [Thermodesulfobacteriota bacterium]
MPENKIFLDTNILIYAYDVSAGNKHKTAKTIMMDLWNSGRGLISIQVLQEFFVNITKKVSKPLEIKLARDIIRDLLKWEVVTIDGESLLEAIELHVRHQYSLWDSMILKAAQKGGAIVLLSEDLKDGQTIDGVTIKNPFMETPPL